MAGTGSRAGRLTKAALLGLGAGAVGAAIYYAVLALTGYNVGLVAIVVGMLVGRAVRRGSGNRGGLGYQFLAAGITYLAIASTFVPMALKEIAGADGGASTEAVSGTTDGAAPQGSSTGTPAAAPGTASSAPKESAPAEDAAPGSVVIAVIALVGLTLALPILAAFGGNIISLLIVGFGVWEAWRVNKRFTIDITGPHELATRPPSQPAAHG